MSETVLQQLKQAKQHTKDRELLQAFDAAIREIKHLNDIVEGYKRITRAQ